MKKVAFASIGLGLFFVCACVSHAGTVLADTFSYPDGSLVGATGSPWTHHSGATVGEQNVISGELFLDDSEAEDTRAEFAGTTLSTGFTSGILTATFQLRMDPNHVTTSISGNRVAHFFGDDNSGGSPNSFYGLIYTKAASGTNFNLGLSNDNVSTKYFLGTPLVAGTNYDLTLKFDIDSGASSLNVSGVGTINATDSVNVFRMNAFAFSQSALTGDLFVDNLTVNFAPVPEPTSFSIFGAMALMLGWRRRIPLG